jgi:(S)-ureidoglycine aminohydrolase
VTAADVGSALSRTVVARDHALVAPEGHVPETLPGWSDAASVVLVAPAVGAGFSMSLANLGAGGRMGAPEPDIGRALYVLDGSVRVNIAGTDNELGAEGYAYLPAGIAHEVSAVASARVCFFDKPYIPLAGVATPEVLVGTAPEVDPQPLPDAEGVTVRALIPADPAYDLAVNVMEYVPGAALPFVESHVMEHGLLMLDGAMVYRLGDAWYPVGAGDAIWMAPFCPQWCCAYGATPARYLIYKDWNRGPLA